MRSLQYMIDVMTAARDGKKIEYRELNVRSMDFTLIDPAKDYYPSWDWHHKDYRIAPEPPKAREWWLIPNNNSTAGPWMTVLPTRPWGDDFIHVREVLPGDK